jgi:hypothetical protein
LVYTLADLGENGIRQTWRGLQDYFPVWLMMAFPAPAIHPSKGVVPLMSTTEVIVFDVSRSLSE